MGQDRNKKLLNNDCHRQNRLWRKIAVISANSFQLTEAVNRHSSLQSNLWGLVWDLQETRSRIIGESWEPSEKYKSVRCFPVKIRETTRVLA